MDRPDDLATLLLDVRDGARPLDQVPDAALPQSEADAYAVQLIVVERLGGIAGWKVGAPDPAASHFTCAPLPAGTVHDHETVIAGSDRGVEAEIAVRFRHDLPPREAPYTGAPYTGAPYTEAEVLDAIGSAHPALEVLATRYADPVAAGKMAGLADSLSNHSLVLGPAIAGWRDIDLDAETVEVLVDGAVVKQGRGNPGGEMLRLLVWMANVGTVSCGGLRAGQVVTTGSWTGKDVAPSGATVQARFAHCGTARLRLA